MGSALITAWTIAITGWRGVGKRGRREERVGGRKEAEDSYLRLGIREADNFSLRFKRKIWQIMMSQKDFREHEVASENSLGCSTVVMPFLCL